LHLAQVLQMALQSGPLGPSGDLPERAVVIDHARARVESWKLGAAALAAGVVVAAIAGARRHRPGVGSASC
jgi:hypothetical protein